MDRANNRILIISILYEKLAKNIEKLVDNVLFINFHILIESVKNKFSRFRLMPEF